MAFPVGQSLLLAKSSRKPVIEDPRDVFGIHLTRFGAGQAAGGSCECTHHLRLRLPPSDPPEDQDSEPSEYEFTPPQKAEFCAGRVLDGMGRQVLHRRRRCACHPRISPGNLFRLAEGVGSVVIGICTWSVASSLRRVAGHRSGHQLRSIGRRPVAVAIRHSTLADPDHCGVGDRGVGRDGVDNRARLPFSRCRSRLVFWKARRE